AWNFLLCRTIDFSMIRHGLILILLIAASCTKNTDEAQTYHGREKIALIKEQIIAFSDSINTLVKGSIEQESLIYTINDYSFHVTRYVRGSDVSLYIEHGYSASSGRVENRYYLKNGKVVLYSHYLNNPQSLVPYKLVREFYDAGELLLSDHKTAKTADELDSTAFVRRIARRTDRNTDIRTLNEAVYQRGAFNLSLEGITQYPGAKYLILSSNKVNSYRAALLIKKEDALIKSVIADPEKYRGRKVDLDWKLEEQNQALYVSGRLRY
ncbi:MAG TPA: hypothetical protein VGE58_07870, partial [Daejeonella sp.]